jgi:spermidine synthase
MTNGDDPAPPPPRGVHVLADLWGCDRERIDDPAFVVATLRRAATAARATVLRVNSHRFEPHGVTAVALLAESHLAIHTWPEHGYAAVDALTCGTTMRPQTCVDLLQEALGATDSEVVVADRGVRPAPDLVGAPRWFTERELPYGRPGVRIGLEVTGVRYDERSPYGHIQVLDTPFHGRTLVIDGVVQTTEHDEFIYHEMMVLAPSIQHGAPATMLIVGGGDGGALRQALRLRSLDKVVQVEIDETVTKVCRAHLPGISGGAFDDPRVELVFADGAGYVASRTGDFDVVVLDLTDPVPGGPAEPLFAEDFLRQAGDALAPGGVLAMQCGSLTMQPDEVRTQLHRLRAVFEGTRLHTAVVPGYQLTTFGFLLAARHPLEVPSDLDDRWRNIAGDCAYLSPEMYRASTAIPPYLREVLQI